MSVHLDTPPGTRVRVLTFGKGPAPSLVGKVGTVLGRTYGSLPFVLVELDDKASHTGRPWHFLPDELDQVLL